MDTCRGHRINTPPNFHLTRYITRPGQNMAGPCSSGFYNVNSWILNAHLHVSVAVLVIFVPCGTK